jgi:hypothetical protein
VQALAGFCLLLFVVVATGVGLRMLWLARRTRGVPELLMGAGMVLIAGVGYPATLAAGFGRPVGEMSVAGYAAGSLMTQIGIALIYAFTQQVFRPGVGWAHALVAAGCGFMTLSLFGTTFTLAVAEASEPSYLVARGWLGLGMVGYSAGFLWTAIEGLVHHRKALRRLALGLADPVVTNRFLLWGVFGLMATGINVTSAAGNALGIDPSRAPLVLVPLGFLGAIACVAMYLAFFPPAWYLAHVRGAAKA